MTTPAHTPSPATIDGRSPLDAPPAVRSLIDSYTAGLLGRETGWAMAFLMVARTQPDSQHVAESSRGNGITFNVAAYTIEPDTSGDYAVHEQPAAQFLTSEQTVAAVQALGAPANVTPGTSGTPGTPGSPVDRLLWVRIDRDTDAPFQDDTRPDYSPIQATWADLHLPGLRPERLTEFDFLASIDAAVRPHYA